MLNTIHILIIFITLNILSIKLIETLSTQEIINDFKQNEILFLVNTLPFPYGLEHVTMPMKH